LDFRKILPIQNNRFWNLQFARQKLLYANTLVLGVEASSENQKMKKCAIIKGPLSLAVLILLTVGCVNHQGEKPSLRSDVSTANASLCFGLNDASKLKCEVKVEKDLKELFLKNFGFNRYFLTIFLSGFVIRFILSIFKACAIRQGEADYWDEVTGARVIYRGKSRWVRFRNAFIGFSKDQQRRTIDDYWLAPLTGFAELYAYPIFIVANKWEFTGAWITIKVASTWGSWQRTRTAYSRFLFGNLLVLVVSLFFLCKLVKS